MKEQPIKVIAFDADDTLWSNEPFFQEIEKQYTNLLQPYGTSEDIGAEYEPLSVDVNLSNT